MPFNPLGFLSGFLGPQSIPTLLQIGVGYVAVLWIFLILWVAKDASHRSDSLFFQLVAVLIIVITTPLIGIPLYLLIRPSTTVIEREMYDMLHYIVTEADRDEEEIEEVVMVKNGKKDKKSKVRETEDRDEGVTYVDEEEE